MHESHFTETRDAFPRPRANPFDCSFKRSDPALSNELLNVFSCVREVIAIFPKSMFGPAARGLPADNTNDLIPQNWSV